MRRMVSAGVLMALVFLIPAAPAAARAETSGLDAACQTVERKIFEDIRELVTIDLDTATDIEVRVVANQIMSATKDDSFPVLPPALQERLDGTEEDLRAFLKKGMYSAWTADLRISIGRTMTDAKANVLAAAQKVLNSGTFDTYLAYLNEGLYAARALDCASQPSPSASPSATPTATTTAAPVPTASASTDAPGDEDGGLPVTGADTGTVAAIGGALLLLGGVGYLIGRRRRSRFVA
jgi:LPXTG-motif cell wall-anchored protein